MKKLSTDELNRLTVEEFKETTKTPITVVLDNIRSLSNIGSTFRTSDAFAIEHIILTGITAQPPHREIHKTALGATESVSWSYEANTTDSIAALKKKGYEIVSIEQVDTSVLLCDFSPVKNKKYAVIFGNEVHGVSDSVVEQSDICIEIPQYGTKHSLNVSVSVGIVLWDMLLKLK